MQTIRAERDRAKAAKPPAQNLSHVRVVIGPPCSGKSTFVRQSMQPGDVVVDFDSIAEALGSVGEHDHQLLHQQLAHEAREAAIIRFRQQHSTATMWVILTDRQGCRRLGLQDAETIVMHTPTDECLRRAQMQDRNSSVLDAIRTWTD